ncbi:hypothetical protein [Streptomyces sp. FIT100]|nr:hypothetical protein [Streptomyces sp. FIT100]UUN29711.1 hypothetical protein KK483_27555 [Streptomyces sp. FIT100]
MPPESAATPRKATTPQLVPITVDGVSYLVPQRLAKAYERGLLRPEG